MRWRSSVLVTLTLLAASSGAQAQIGQTATLSGTVADAQGNVVPGVTVTVTGPALIGNARTRVTDGNGTYRFASIPPGLYDVTFELQESCAAQARGRSSPAGRSDHAGGHASSRNDAARSSGRSRSAVCGGHRIRAAETRHA